MRKLLPAMLLVMIPVVPVRAWSQFLQQLRSDFVYSFEQYRSAYTDFSIARSQYESVPTFAHEETLARKAQVMLNTRDQVWWTYFAALKQEVVEMSFLDAADSSFLVATISAQQQFVDDHKKLVNTIEGRSPLMDAAEQVNGISDLFAAISYFTQSRLKLGYMVRAITEIEQYARILKEAISLQIRDEGAKTVRLRGVDEVLYRVGKVREQLDKPQEDWAYYARGSGGDSAFDRVVEEYRPHFSEVSQMYALLAELSQGVEL